jgi:hypothetical protein
MASQRTDATHPGHPWLTRLRAARTRSTRKPEDLDMIEDLQDPRRTEPAFIADERQMLESWLEFHRTTLLLKCEGVSRNGLIARPVPTSKLSLHGLIRHMAEVERSWFTRVLLRAPDTPHLFADSAISDRVFEPIEDADWKHDLAVWQAECEHSRTTAQRFSLDHTGLRRGQECSLRWIYVHMIEEYARHNGHADLIREMVDGAVGW